MKRKKDIINEEFNKISGMSLENVFRYALTYKVDEIKSLKREIAGLKSQISVLEQTVEELFAEKTELAIPAGHYKSFIETLGQSPSLQGEFVRFMAMVKLFGEEGEVETLGG